MMRGKLNFFGQTVGRRGHSFLMMWDILDVQAKEKRKKPAWQKACLATILASVNPSYCS